jgi:hypothetical protein
MRADDLYAARESELHAEALEILGHLLTWHLPSGRWAQAEQVIDEVATAMASGDLPALDRAIAGLELLGPVRVTRIGESSESQLTPPPDPVRERVNRLIHSLGQPARPDPAQRAARPGARGADHSAPGAD